MNEKFEEILDQCIDSINSGQSIDECLDLYPEHAGELLPLLKTVASAHKAAQFTPSAEKKQAARQQLIAAMGGVEPVFEAKSSFWAGIFGKTKVWASATALAIVALIAVFGVMPLLNSPNPNFAFLISDDPTIMELFEKVDVTIGQVKVYHADDGWQTVLDAPTTIDLTKVKGNLAEQIWQGNLPVGNYTKVSVTVTGISAIMVDVPGTINVPINASLELPIPFDIVDNEVTNYVYDLTLSPDIDDYNLTPITVEEESGPNQDFELVSP